MGWVRMTGAKGPMSGTFSDRQPTSTCKLIEPPAITAVRKCTPTVKERCYDRAGVDSCSARGSFWIAQQRSETGQLLVVATSWTSSSAAYAETTGDLMATVSPDGLRDLESRRAGPR